MSNAFSLVEWTKASPEARSQVTRELSKIVAKMANDEANKGIEPSAEYGAFSAAHRLLHYLADPNNIKTLPEDFKRALPFYRKR